MLRVILVDDEPYIAQGLTKLVNWQEEGFEIMEVFANGKEALAYLREHTVELIIADIKMPEMNGLELLEKIRTEQISDAQFIFLSGYGDFSYAQKAIKYHVLDYIIKPVEKDKLLELLRKVAHLSESARSNQEEQKRQAQAYLARNVISMLVGKYDELNLEYVKKHMKVSGGVRFIDIESEKSLMEESDADKRQEQRNLYEKCRSYLKDDSNHVIFDVSQNEKSYDIGLIYCDYMAEQRNMNEQSFLEELSRQLKLLLNQEIYLYVGKKVTDISMISKSYGTACILKSLEAFHSKKSIYYYEEEVQVGKSGVLLCKKGLDALLLSIERNEKESISKCVEDLFEEMRQLGCAAEVVNLNINYLLFQLIHIATEQDDGVDQDEILHFISESSFEEGFLRGGSRHLTRFALEYAEYLSQLRKNISSGVLAEVEREIREHYTENLSLKELGSRFFVNSSYLGQIFRKKYEMSFKDYLTNYRINEAAKLLIKTDKKITQIAEEVGYRDSDYFIRKFIEIKGLTPSKYRRSEK